MNIEDNQTSNIYDNIINQVTILLNEFQQESDEEIIKAAQAEAYKVFSAYYDNLMKDYNQLKQNTEWKKFTIAFYGETNAGKSTIIELLRIILREKSKTETILKFKKIEQEHNISQEAFDVIRNKIMNLDDENEKIKNTINNLQKTKIQEIDNYDHELAQLQDEYAVEKEKWGFFQKIIHFFIKTEIQKLITEKEKIVKKLKKELDIEETKLKKAMDICATEAIELRAKEKTMLKECLLLEPFRDGSIIGTGISDFTRVNTSYSFDFRGVEFDLIDVPGIEGNEQVVTDSIMEAVQKAHSVFYVTRKPAPPQSSQDGEGTLEKIKKHLGAQTEVWTIFNQAINNPTRMQRGLVDEDDTSGLENLNNVIKEKLGEDHYRGEIVLSAYPAFLAVAECLIPGNKDKQNQMKFLNKYSVDEILEYSGVNSFINGLPEQVVGDWKLKIIRSNYNKAVVTLQKTIEMISDMQKQHFQPIEKALETNSKDSAKALDNGFEIFKDNLEMAINRFLREFENEATQRIYDEIDGDISNDHFKRELKDILEEQQTKLKDVFMTKCDDEMNNYQKDIEKILDNSKKHMEDILNFSYSIPNFGDVKLNSEPDSGINIWAGVGTIAGAIALYCATGPVGWTIGVVSLLLSAWSTFRSWFSTSYKMEQQRKVANENISGCKQECKKTVESSLDAFCQNLEIEVANLKDQLKKPSLVVRDINDRLSSCNKKLENIAMNIKQEAYKREK